MRKWIDILLEHNGSGGDAKKRGWTVSPEDFLGNTKWSVNRPDGSWFMYEDSEEEGWETANYQIRYEKRKAKGLAIERDSYPEEDHYSYDEESDLQGAKYARKFRYYDDKGIMFRVMDHDAQKHVSTRPLAVIIHPGDMIIHAWGSYGLSPEDREILRRNIKWANANQEGMRDEIKMLKRKGYDFVVLHRESSVQYPESLHKPHTKKVWAEIQSGHKRGSVIFGDDLDRAGQWMINNLHIAERPHIYMLGAYSDPKVGCLTHIGKQFAQVIDPSKITVSEFSPVSDDPDEQSKAWRP